MNIVKVKDIATIKVDHTIQTLLNLIKQYHQKKAQFCIGYELENSTYTLTAQNDFELPCSCLIVNVPTFKDKLIHIFSLYDIKDCTLLLKLKIIEVIYNYTDCKETLQVALQELQLNQTKITFNDIKKINNIPMQLIKYLSEKNVSLKQLKLFQRFNKHMLNWLINPLIEKTKPSLSILLEIAQSTNDLCNRNKITFENLQQQFYVDLTKPNALNQLRLKIKQLHHPTLTQANNHIEKQINLLDLNKKTSIKWDKTLENKELIVTCSIQKPKDLDQIETLIKLKPTLLSLLDKFNYAKLN